MKNSKNKERAESFVCVPYMPSARTFRKRKEV